MPKAKFDHPRSKVRARKDHPSSLVSTIPEKIAHAMRLQAGHSIEWIWSTSGYESYCKVVKEQPV
jgi:hypothetical protein